MSKRKSTESAPVPTSVLTKEQATAVLEPPAQPVAVRQTFGTELVTDVHGAHLYKPGDMLPNGNTCKQTVLIVPSLKELKDRPENAGKSSDDLKAEIADIGRAAKPVASALVNAAMSDNSFMVRRLSISRNKNGLHSMNLNVKQVDTEDLVDKLCRIHGKNPTEVRKALGIADLTVAV